MTSSRRPVASLEIAAEPVAGTAMTCPFCREEIKPGASICKHCGSTLSPVHQLVLAHAALEARLAGVEADLAASRLAPPDVKAALAKPSEDKAAARGSGWPHMFDNLFLGLAALLAAHWLASTVPHSQQALYRLVALAVALPFGFRYEIYARAATIAQVGAAVVFGVLGGLLVAALDVAISGAPAEALARIQATDVVETIAVIGLSHLTGSWLAWWGRREERREATAAFAARRRAVGTGFAMLMRAEPEMIKSRIDALHKVLDLSAPAAAGAATLWAAFGRLLF